MKASDFKAMLCDAMIELEGDEAKCSEIDKPKRNQTGVNGKPVRFKPSELMLKQADALLSRVDCVDYPK